MYANQHLRSFCLVWFHFPGDFPSCQRWASWSEGSGWWPFNTFFKWLSWNSIPNSQSQPVLPGSQGHASFCFPSLSHHLCPKPHPFAVCSLFCGEHRKRVPLVEPFLVPSNQGKLRQRTPASTPLLSPVGTWLLRKVIPSCGCLLSPARASYVC